MSQPTAEPGALLPPWVLERLEQWPRLVGALGYGSRALGQASPNSDLDLLIVVDSVQAPPAERWLGPDHLEADLHFLSLEDWTSLAQHAHWQHFGLAQGKTLLDPQGVIRTGLDALQTPPSSHLDGALGALDSYLNSTYRSVKTWRRGDELGGRLHAGVALTALLDGLFRLAGRWTPYWDRLEGQWEHLSGLGLDVTRLEQQIDAVARDPAPETQITLYEFVAGWMRLHGHTAVLEAWPPEFHKALQPTQEPQESLLQAVPQSSEETT